MSILDVTKLVNKIEKFVRDSDADPRETHLSLSAVVGSVIGTQLAVPSSPVKNKRLHYQEHIYPTTSNYVNQINEAHAVDVDLALECAWMIWHDRYSVVHTTSINISDLIYRLNCTTTNRTFVDTNLMDSAVRVLSATEIPLMQSVFSELFNQLQGPSEE